jgi:tetratricopeptide (TPR) repeat protein
MTSFPKIGESFYSLTIGSSFGKCNPKAFYNGGEPTWGDIANKIAPERDAYWNVYETLFNELSNPSSPSSVYLVTGAAGTGKTTLIHALAYSLATEFDLPVLIHIPSTPLDVNPIKSLIDAKNTKRIIVVVKHAAEYLMALSNFITDLRAKKMPVTVLLEERKNQWLSAITNYRKELSVPQFELGTLSTEEIKRILDALSEYKLLGKLTGSPIDVQIDHFEKLAQDDLLVALRELTSEERFDVIIRDEFNNIPSEIAKKAYVYVSALSQIDLSIRYETLMRILDLDYEKLKSEIFIPAAGVLISGEVIGFSRHNLGYKLGTRHPIIASVIFASAADHDEDKFQIFNDIISAMDIGFNDDSRLLQGIIKNRQLVNVFKSDEKKRAFYDRLESILPDSPYVLQHRSILEKDLDNSSSAVLYARRALAIDPKNLMLKNTLGLALESENAMSLNKQSIKH